MTTFVIFIFLIFLYLNLVIGFFRYLSCRLAFYYMLQSDRLMLSLSKPKVQLGRHYIDKIQYKISYSLFEPQKSCKYQSFWYKLGKNLRKVESHQPKQSEEG